MASHKRKVLHNCQSHLADTGIKITSQGRPYLGATIGTEEFVQSHVEGRAVGWTKELENLVTIALTHPHAAHAALTHSLSSKWSFLACTIRGIGPLPQSLETIIGVKLIPALTGQPPPMQYVTSWPYQPVWVALP